MGYEIRIVVSETSDGAVPFEDDREDGSMTYCFGGHTGAKLHTETEASSGLYGLKIRTEQYQRLLHTQESVHPTDYAQCHISQHETSHYKGCE